MPDKLTRLIPDRNIMNKLDLKDIFGKCNQANKVV